MSDRRPLRTGLLLLGWVLTALVGTNFVLVPALLLLFMGETAYNLFRRLARGGSNAWHSCAAALLELLAGVRIDLRGQGPLASDRRLLVICNHHCRLDWIFLWPVFARMRRLGSLQVALKADLKSVPVFGWAVQAFLYLFIDRNDRAGSLASMGRTIDHVVCQRGEEITLLIFPEGTDLSPSQLRKSNEHAVSKGLPQTAHVLCPRPAGFATAVRSMGGQLDAVLDLTISCREIAVDMS